jgi:hypothetical protein
LALKGTVDYFGFSSRFTGSLVSLVLGFTGSLVTLVLWFSGSLVLWFSGYLGSLVRWLLWFSGSLVTLVLWFSGYFGSLVLGLLGLSGSLFSGNFLYGFPDFGAVKISLGLRVAPHPWPFSSAARQEKGKVRRVIVASDDVEIERVVGCDEYMSRKCCGYE